MENLILIAIVCLALYAAYRYYRKLVIAKREQLINSYVFPGSIVEKLMDKYPHLDKQQANKVIRGLREYFHISNMAGKKMVAMPSQVVDDAWHEFILFTKKYDHFCKKALGRFLHHTPAEAMKSQFSAEEGIKRAWKLSCGRENLKPRAADKLPLLFAMDTDLNIPKGFKYTLDCSGRGDRYCASHIGCSSAIGCGSRCSGSSSGCISGCSSGCSGGGGGGCGGGD